MRNPQETLLVNVGPILKKLSFQKRIQKFSFLGKINRVLQVEVAQESLLRSKVDSAPIQKKKKKTMK